MDFLCFFLLETGFIVLQIGSMATDTLCRGKRSIAVNLRQPAGVELVKKACLNADVLIEPFRPGEIFSGEYFV